MQPGFPSPHCHRPLACDVWPVVYEKVSRDNSLVLGQHNLLQKIGAKVLLHPSILRVTEEKMALDGARGVTHLEPRHSEGKEAGIRDKLRQLHAQEFALRSYVPAHPSLRL